MTAILKSST